MTRTTAFAILSFFSLGGVAVAGWGAFDVVTALTEMDQNTAVVFVDSSAFWFLGLFCLPAFPCLALLPEQWHRTLLVGAVLIALSLPVCGFLVTADKVKTMGYQFEPPLTLFPLRMSQGQKLD
ncbi:hypothetical protein TRM7557_01726 [Tritonibacter multivorans]|uniref:Uncharacterized protein n=1 Tax=Tritonibacter multivorans TaxID=928856 RepID=A0A0P1GQV8_9RHOB|nr:hypothetical protein [Tritonibacter multivorans]MDA7422924.1 hypothetical protein [Tritonibacter multivorans]CUH78107.1 hypothetical protein TRM7557_01726 [Tritonibacter multivorans]SFD75404.1 hypothetical protein SAMN04488049_12621 [Tritonibacter multivorans]